MQSSVVQETATLEAVGQALVRYGLVLVVGWIGAMKFTAYEAAGRTPLRRRRRSGRGREPMDSSRRTSAAALSALPQPCGGR